MDLLNKIAANVSVDKIRNLAEDAINQAKPKTDVEARVYEALSHKNWGSSSTLMNEIARDTFDYDRFSVVTMSLWESLSNPRPAAWRVVFKGLSLLEHLIKNGSERCVDDARNHSHILRNLHNFNYYEGTIDRGVGVREKAKQIVELLADDERIREERLKAKQLREKFGGNLGGVSNTGSMQGFGGGGSSGGGGGSSYPGYGNNTNDSNYGGYHGSGSYGNSGIGSSGGFHDNDDKGFSGRYSEEDNVNASPTFATLPEKKTKKKSNKKTKKKEKSDSPAPDIDLLALDDDIPPAASKTDSFDAFQSAGGDDDHGFDAFQSAPTEIVSDSVDAFGSMQQSQQQVFDAFGANPPPSQPSFDAFGSSNATTGDMNNMFGNMSVGATNSATSRPIMGGNAAIMSGGSKVSQNSNQDDEFGDFDDGTSGKNSTKSADPLANLISLDSLTKNTKKQDVTNQPIAFNDAAKQFIEKGPSAKPVTMSKEAADMAFSGVDGLPKHHAAPMIHMNNISTGHNPSVMMSGGGSNANAIDSVFPDVVAQKAQMQQQQRQMMMMQQQQHQMMMMQQQQYQMSSMPASMGSMGNNTMMNNHNQQDQNPSMGGSQFNMNGGMSPMGGQGMGTPGMGGQSMQGWS
jgi:epsin